MKGSPKADHGISEVYFFGGVSMSRAKRTPEKQDAAIRAYRSGEVSCSWIKKYREDSEGGLEDMRIR